MVKLLLCKGAQLDKTILFGIVNFQIIKYLLKRGANPKATDRFANTMLHKHCKSGNLKKAKYLIEHYNADVNAKNDKGQTPLHLACKGFYFGLPKSNLKLVKFLIEEKKADPTVTCNEGKSALHYAAENEYGPSILKYIIEDQKLDTEATDNERRTVLHMAFQNFANLGTQKYLIEEHPKIIHAIDKTGKTALHYFLKTSEELIKRFFFFALAYRSIALILDEIVKERDSNETDIIFDWIQQSYASGMKKDREDDEVVSCLIVGLQIFQEELHKKFETEIQYNPLLNISFFCKRYEEQK
jgi:hypothetical protein